VASDGPCVLVVDDDPLIRKVVRAVLEANDVRVVEAPDGSTGLDVAATERPKVVILDVMMPGLNGVETCRRIDKSVSRVLMLTARTDDYTENASYDAGADAYLTKPFSSVELLERVEALLRS